jgi:hypothetical protein
MRPEMPPATPRSSGVGSMYVIGDILVPDARLTDLVYY